MGCFGIGTTRLLAAAVENLSHSEEIRWPRLIAPHQICIIPQKVESLLAYASYFVFPMSVNICPLPPSIVGRL